MNIAYCDFCDWSQGKASIARHTCEICGLNYCEDCASRKDEGGWNCPDKDCAGYGE